MTYPTATRDKRISIANLAAREHYDERRSAWVRQYHAPRGERVPVPFLTGDMRSQPVPTWFAWLFLCIACLVLGWVFGRAV